MKTLTIINTPGILTLILCGFVLFLLFLKYKKELNQATHNAMQNGYKTGYQAALNEVSQFTNRTSKEKFRLFMQFMSDHELSFTNHPEHGLVLTDHKPISSKANSECHETIGLISVSKTNEGNVKFSVPKTNRNGVDKKAND